MATLKAVCKFSSHGGAGVSQPRLFVFCCFLSKCWLVPTLF